MRGSARPIAPSKRGFDGHLAPIHWLIVGVALVIGATGVTAAAAALGHMTVGRQSDGSVVVPTDQVITPVGHQVEFAGRPNAVAISPDGTTAALLTASGLMFSVDQGSGAPVRIVLIDLATGSIKQEFDPGEGTASFDGVVYSQDGRHLYASLATGKLLIADVSPNGTLSLNALVSLPSAGGNPYPGGLALSSDGNTLYIALNQHNTLGIFDLVTRSLSAEIRVGNAPSSVVVSGKTAYVTNEGGRIAAAGDTTNQSAGTAIVADPMSGGSMTGTVSVVDLMTRSVSQTIPVGLHPTAMVLNDRNLFVANTNSDTISIIDTGRNQVSGTVSVKPFARAPFGSSPNALALMGGSDHRQLVVSLGANNALAVYELGKSESDTSASDSDDTTATESPSARLLGLIPTAWYPGSIAFDPHREQLVVANVKGVGSLQSDRLQGPDPSTTRSGKTANNSRGSASIIPEPTRRDLRHDSEQVAQNNGWDRMDESTEPLANERDPDTIHAIPLHIGDPSPIKHIFYIIKENRTYDQVLGDDARGNGDVAMLQFGEDITPNQHALAKQFPLMDNLYAGSIASADGHQWTDQALVPSYIEKMYGDFVRSYPFNGGDSLTYLPSGFLWENALRHGRTVRNYGEYANQFVGPPGQNQYNQTWSDWFHDAKVLENAETGELHVPLGTFQTHSDVPSNDQVLNRDFPPYTTAIPDQYRADIFLREFESYVKQGNLPNLIMMELPDDHTSGTAPGRPTPRAQVADNDLALGRMVEAISHSQYWKESAIFVIEDDPYDGVDHVDGHRTTAYVVSPYARRGFVDSTYYTQIDIVRTIEQILGLPPMNQMDLAASPMREAFTDTPNVAPYSAVPNRVPLDEMNGAPHSGRVDESDNASALEDAWTSASADLFRTQTFVPDQQDPRLLNRAIWYSVKGYTTPYPGDAKVLSPDDVVAAAGSGVQARPNDGDDD